MCSRTGPTRSPTYKPGVQIVLQRNPVWKASSDPIRKAYVNKIVINEGETPQSRPAADPGRHRRSCPGMSWCPPPDLPSLYGNPDLAVNSSDAVLYAVFNEQSPNDNGAMKNVKVRQALEYAINKAAIAQAYGGTQDRHARQPDPRPDRHRLPAVRPLPHGGQHGRPAEGQATAGRSRLPQRDHGEAALPDHLQQPADRRAHAGRPSGGRGEGADGRCHADRLHGQLHLRPAERRSAASGISPCCSGCRTGSGSTDGRCSSR